MTWPSSLVPRGLEGGVYCCGTFCEVALMLMLMLFVGGRCMYVFDEWMTKYRLGVYE